MMNKRIIFFVMCMYVTVASSMEKQPTREIRNLTVNEEAIIAAMPSGVKYCVVRGIIWRWFVTENGVRSKRVVKQSYWINNQFVMINENHLDRYQNYGQYSNQNTHNEQPYVEL